MKRILILAALAAAGILGYQYYQNGTMEFPVLKFFEHKGPPPLPTKDEKGNPVVPCPKCGATGRLPCVARGCKDGKVLCPGRCLKESDFKERWPKPLPGHDPDEPWIIFHLSGGRVQGLSIGHKGDVAGVQNGEYYNRGSCPICKGTTFVDCKICAGTGFVACPACGGSRVVRAPQTSKPPSGAAPRQASSGSGATPAPGTPGPILLKGGRTIEGTIVARDENTAWIRTPDGQRIPVKVSEIVAE